MGDIHTLVRTLRQFERSGAVSKAVRQKIREPVPVVRRRIKAVAVATLPSSGGLGRWVAATKITASFTFVGKGAGIRLRGGRRSAANLRGTTVGGQSDIRAIDRGRVRHPFWGRRFRGQWRTQNVTPGFFTKTAAESPEWDKAITEALDIAVKEIHA